MVVRGSIKGEIIYIYSYYTRVVGVCVVKVFCLFLDLFISKGFNLVFSVF